MQVVGHDFKREYLNSEFFHRFVYDSLKPVPELSDKYRPAPLWTPHEVVVHQIHMMLSTFVFHVDSLTEHTAKVKNYFAIHLLNKFRSFLAWVL